ncbi:hypothetical protein [Chryseobacterium sp. BIGb0232]|uniref:hypothetical protein n=1 Tax=Chryseobacterium sp. BIGb0232 TaxID=2940598 RepID=UPI000F477B34|nr:hypothetical protein [Chryseobacterium sp. BIGb0232]MCS4300676.1 hypothetical protein [Chryseobacterium sp. BIGb0232]ROS20442.1 hypothetical protein EDF65_1163 [Chryseobacterium nakagawai]
MGKEFILSTSEKKTNIENYPSLKNCLTDIKGFKNRLLPVIKLDGSVVAEKWKDIPFTFILHNDDVSRIDFQLVDGKYQLITPLTKKMLDQYQRVKRLEKREYLQTWAEDYIEYPSYERVDKYTNDGHLIQSGSDRYHPNDRAVYDYEMINGTSMPVTKTVQYYLGNRKWQSLEFFRYHYDANGFLKEITLHIPTCEVKINEKILYKKNSKGFTVSKKMAKHLIPIKKINSYSKQKSFSAVFNKNKADWNVKVDYWSIHGIQDENVTADVGEVIKKFAFEHFYNSYSGINYNFTKERRDGIHVKISEKEGLPDMFEFTLNCLEKNDICSKNYIEKSDDKVILDWGNGKFTFEHFGYIIKITKEQYFRSKRFSISGQYTLQQAVMMLVTQSYLWWHDFEQKRILDGLMHPYGSDPILLNFKNSKTKNGIHRIIEAISIDREGDEEDGEPFDKLWIGEQAAWEKDDETPLDPDGQKMKFVAQFYRYHLFGTLYLFYSEKHQIISQIFQDT